VIARFLSLSDFCSIALPLRLPLSLKFAFVGVAVGVHSLIDFSAIVIGPDFQETFSAAELLLPRFSNLFGRPSRPNGHERVLALISSRFVALYLRLALLCEALLVALRHSGEQALSAPLGVNHFGWPGASPCGHLGFAHWIRSGNSFCHGGGSSDAAAACTATTLTVRRRRRPGVGAVFLTPLLSQPSERTASASAPAT
jgi:hypothetical protein